MLSVLHGTVLERTAIQFIQLLWNWEINYHRHKKPPQGYPTTYSLVSMHSFPCSPFHSYSPTKI